MSQAIFFDDLGEAAAQGYKRKPFFAIDHSSDDELLRWFKEEISYLKDEYKEWHEEIKNNYKRFKEIQYKTQIFSSRDLPDKKTRYTPNIVAPLVRDITDERIARMMEFKPNVVILPQHDEQQDKVDAKIAKKFVKHIEKQERIDYKLQKFLRTAYVAGEGYLILTWNPDKGYPMPDSEKVGKTVFVGDIDVRHASPLRLLMEKRLDDGEPEYCFYFEYEYGDVLKKKYPSKALDLDKRSATYYDAEKMEDVTVPGKVTKVTFWHKKTPFLPDGFECVFVEDTILKKSPLPYQHGKIPVVVLTDNENIEESHGRSFINSIKGMVTYFNNLLNMGVKQMTLMSWPKWFVDAGSVDPQQLNNDTGIVTIKPGSRAPVLSQGSPVSPQLMAWKDRALEWIYAWGKSNSVIRGDPPTGVTAFVALQYVSESENRRMNTSVVKFNEAVRLMYEMVLTTCGQYYKKEDKRTLLVIGKDGSWSAENYDPSSLAKPYSIVIQNASALPDSKAARTQYIIDLAKNFPDLFPKEQLIEMLDLAQSDKFIDEASSAARAAEAENEMMMEGEDPGEPQPHEYLIVHWKIHLSAMQDIGFKQKATPETKKLFEEHLLATEYLMFEKAKKSETFLSELMKLPLYPIYFEADLKEIMAPPPPPPPSQPIPMPGEGEVLPPPMPMSEMTQGLIPNQGDPLIPIEPSVDIDAEKQDIANQGVPVGQQV